MVDRDARLGGHTRVPDPLVPRPAEDSGALAYISGQPDVLEHLEHLPRAHDPDRGRHRLEMTEELGPVDQHRR